MLDTKYIYKVENANPFYISVLLEKGGIQQSWVGKVEDMISIIWFL